MLLPLTYAATEVKELCFKKTGFLVYDPLKAAFLVIITKTLLGIWPSIPFSQFSDERPGAAECALILTRLTVYRAGVFFKSLLNRLKFVGT